MSHLLHHRCWLWALYFCSVLPFTALPQIAVAQGTDAPQPPVYALSAANQADVSGYFLAREGVPAKVGIEQMAAEPVSAFKPFSSRTHYQTDNEHIVWLRLRVVQAEYGTHHSSSNAFDHSWTLDILDTMLNRVDFYHRNADGHWVVQSAGQRIAMNKWPQQGLSPRFDLHDLPAGTHDIYLRVQQSLPVYLAPRLALTKTAVATAQLDFLVAGLVLGFIALMVALSCVLAIAHKTTTYAWYALYAVFTFFAAASYLGLASLYFWPTLDEWPKLSAPVFLMCAVLVQLQFCKSLFLQKHEHPVLLVITRLVMAAVLIAGACFIAIDNAQVRAILFTAATIVCVSNVIWVATTVWRKQKLIVSLWHTAYMPLLFSVIVIAMHRLGLFNMPALPMSLAVYALVFEMVVLLLALNLHARNNVTFNVRQHMLATTDPLTGFLSAPAFKERLQKDWNQALTKRTDLAIAYVQFVDLVKPGWLHASVNQQSHQQRVVRMLHTIARPQDIIASLDATTFAIAMPGMGAGSDLDNKLSRLVALGIMGNNEYPHASALGLRIAAGTQRSYMGVLGALDMALRVKLSDEREWEKLPIQFIKTKPGQKSRTSSLSSLWQRTADASARKSVTSSLPTAG